MVNIIVYPINVDGSAKFGIFLYIINCILGTLIVKYIFPGVSLTNTLNVKKTPRVKRTIATDGDNLREIV